MKYLLSTIILSVTFITLFAQFPHRPKPKPEPTQQQKDISEPIKNDISEKKEENESKAVVEDRFRSLDIVGLHFEKAVSHKHTVVISPNVEFLYLYNDGDFPPSFGIGLLPKIEFSFRNYYNLAKRQSRNKPYKNNSGCYVSGKIELQALLSSFHPGYHDNITSVAIGTLWGVQNNEGPLTVNFEIGPGLFLIMQDDNYYSNSGTIGVAILGKLKFGFLLDR